MNHTIRQLPSRQDGLLYRTIWRWHFYAGLFVIPFILVLSLTGALYLFKPQIDAWEERHWRGFAAAENIRPETQVEAAVTAFPGATFHHYRLPQASGDAAMVHLRLADGSIRDVFVSPAGSVVGNRDPNARLSRLLSRMHGSLLIPPVGDWLVELAASWAIVLILTGLYLWWREGHAAIGIWAAGLALVLLLSGLPWSNLWGDAFAKVRAELGLVAGAQDWRAPAGDHAGHDQAAMARPGPVVARAKVPLDTIVLRARQAELAAPVIIMAPGASDWGTAADTGRWTIKSLTQNRPLRRSIHVDAATGLEIGREEFADKHVIDRVINYGIAWHEGALFGWANQLIGVLTAVMLIALSISGFAMWRRRRPDDQLGAPPAVTQRTRLRGVALIVLALALVLPLLAASLVVLLLFERLVLHHWPRGARWLGVETVSSATA